MLWQISLQSLNACKDFADSYVMFMHKFLILNYTCLSFSRWVSNEIRYLGERCLRGIFISSQCSFTHFIKIIRSTKHPVYVLDLQAVKCNLSIYRSPIIKIRRSYDCLTIIIKIPVFIRVLFAPDHYCKRKWRWTLLWLIILFDVA